MDKASENCVEESLNEILLIRLLEKGQLISNKGSLLQMSTS